MCPGLEFGLAAAIEAITCVKAIQEQIIPPTINYETPDPECGLNITPNVCQERQVRCAMNNAFGFGGHNAVVVFKSI